MFNPLVSCIIPVYNAEKYLVTGIESLLSQTYKNIEVILVDDCSTDDSWTVCMDFSRKFSNVRAYKSKQNAGGPLRGRERGIKESRGEWITFMDCDDYVRPTYVENLVEATHRGKYDIAVTGHSRLHDDGRIDDFYWKDYSQSTDERMLAFYQHFLKHDFWTDPTDTVGQNLIRASVAKKTDLSKYPNTIWAEDTLMALAFLAHSKNGVNFTNKYDFLWRQIEGSGSHGGFSDRADRPAFYGACDDIFHNNEIFKRISKKLPQISIVIPVYNVEQFLRECLDSVARQSYVNIQIIIVDDGSTDSSKTIIDTFKKNEERTIAISQENKGLNLARAAGAAAATGDFIAFIDSDDAVHEEYVSVMYENLVKNNVDISVCGFTEFHHADDIAQPGVARDFATQLLENRQQAIKYYLNRVESIPNIHPMTAWGKLYKSSIIKATDWHFSNYRRHEDNFELLQWYSKAVSGVFAVERPLYYYRKNPDSITHKIQQNTNPDGKKINYFEYLDELYEKSKAYINDESFDVDLLLYFANTNNAQLKNFFEKGVLTNSDMESATSNSNKVNVLFSELIHRERGVIDSQNASLALMRESFSWRITKPIRRVKSAYRKRTSENGKVTDGDKS